MEEPMSSSEHGMSFVNIMAWIFMFSSRQPPLSKLFVAKVGGSETRQAA